MRPTRDVDFLAAADHASVRAAVEAMCAVPCPDDGVIFDAGALLINTIRVDQPDGGLRARLPGALGNIRLSLQMDIGFGDMVTPAREPARLSHPARPAGAAPVDLPARSHGRRYPTTHFGFRKITVERPLRLDFQASPERIARLDDERAFANLAVSRKRDEAGARDEEAGRKQQAAIRAMLGSLPDGLFLHRAAFDDELSRAARDAGLKLAAPIRKAILSALSERNAEAEMCRDRAGRPEPDPELRDTENVPLSEDVESFFERRGEAPRPRRLDRHDAPRPPGRRGRARRLRDQLQPLLLRVPPAPPARGDRGRHPAGGERRSWPCCRRCRADGDTSLTPSRTVDAAEEEVGAEKEQGTFGGRLGPPPVRSSTLRRGGILFFRDLEGGPRTSHVRSGPGRIARLGHQLALANLGVACKRGAAKVREGGGGGAQAAAGDRR